MNINREDMLALEDCISEIEEKEKQGKLKIDEINELLSEVKNAETDDANLKSVLKERLLNVKRRVAGLTKWEMFIEDIMEVEGNEELKSLIKDIDKVKNDILSKEEVEELDKRRVNLLTDINNKFSRNDADKIENEISKKLKLFNNRNDRTIDNEFGEYIYQLRKNKKYSLEKLSELSGVTPSYIFRLEKGLKKAPSVPVAKKLASAFGISNKIFLNKLGLNTDSEVEVEHELNELLIVKDFKINDKEATSETKNKLVDFINLLTTRELDSNNSLKVEDGIALMKEAEAFLRELNKE